ncbi:MAG: hypothetical protein R2831_10665 [Chitinophagaceae bacterium]
MSEQQIEIKKVKKGKATYLYSIIGVALVLFLLGSLGSHHNASQITKTLKKT